MLSGLSLSATSNKKSILPWPDITLDNAYPLVWNPENNNVALSKRISYDIYKPLINSLAIVISPWKKEDFLNKLYKNVVLIGTYFLSESDFIN